jgi:hypothetical protein
MVAGPLDGNHGLYDLNSAHTDRVKVFEEVFSTVVSETARAFVLFSGLAIIPDMPDEYLRKKDLFEFISKISTKWDETRVLNGKIGEYITTARRSDDQWFIGSVYNEQGGSLSIPMDFLDNRKYIATLYEDAADAHYQANKEAYTVRTVTLTKDSVVNAKLAPGGGHCMWVRPDPTSDSKIPIHDQHLDFTLRIEAQGPSIQVNSEKGLNYSLEIYLLNGQRVFGVSSFHSQVFELPRNTLNGNLVVVKLRSEYQMLIKKAVFY